MTIEMRDQLNLDSAVTVARLQKDLTVVASQRFLDPIRGCDSLLGGARLIALELHEDLDPRLLPASGVVALQIDPAFPATMNRIEQVRKWSPNLAIVVALETTDLRLVRTLIRGGVLDVVSLPLQEDELLQAVLSVAQQDVADTGLAPLVAIVRPLGGGGATTLTTHLAASFASAGHSCCLIDGDIQSGRATEVLGMAPRRTLTDLLDAGYAIDETLFEAVVQRHSSGLALVAAPTEIIPIEAIDLEQMLRIVSLARRQYEFVFIDMPASLTNWSLSLLANADEIVMLTEQSLSSLRQAKRLLGLFSSVGIENSTVSIAVNRAQNKLFGTINTSDVEQALGKPVLGVLRPDEANLRVAQDQGLLVHEVRGKSGYAADIGALADKIRARIEEGRT